MRLLAEYLWLRVSISGCEELIENQATQRIEYRFQQYALLLWGNSVAIEGEAS